MIVSSRSSEAAADDLINALSSVAIDAHGFGRSRSRHFQNEVLDQLVELAISQLAVFRFAVLYKLQKFYKV